MNRRHHLAGVRSRGESFGQQGFVARFQVSAHDFKLGFQGGALKDGPQAGFRLQNGWQNSGLPWSAKMNPEKIHRLARP